MMDVPESFKELSLEDFRDPQAKVEITWTDPLIDPQVEVEVNQDNRTSFKDQVIDGLETTSRKWTHLNGNFKLDGSYHYFPSEPNEGQVGWYGDVRGDDGGEWVADPIISVTFTERPVHFIRLVGDSAYDQYPEDFTINVYFESGSIYTDTITGNTELSQTLDLQAEELNAADKIELVVHKWSTPNEVVKIAEFSPSLKTTHYGDDIVSINILEELETQNSSLPIGNISANEIQLQLSNIDNLYQYANPDSVFAPFLRRNRRIKIWLGLKLPVSDVSVSEGDYTVETVDGDRIGLVPYGEYFSGDWSSSVLNPVVSVSARDRMEELRNNIFSTSDLYENINLYDLVEIIMTEARKDIVDIQWNTSTTLSQTVIPFAWFDKKDYFNVLRVIAEVAQTIVYVDRKGVVQIGKNLLYAPA